MFEMRLEEIYKKNDWLEYELPLQDFINMFPVYYDKGLPLKPEMPGDYELGRDIFLQVLVAFKQSLI